MTKGVFVTGSGTGVGKTHVSKLLLNGLSNIGYGATYMKPVETGCEELPNGEVSVGADTAAALKLASYQADDINLHSPYRFVPACSPHLAAVSCGCDISIDRIVLTYENLTENVSADIVVVEGAGGVFVPVNDNNQYMADVMKALSIPVIFVTTPELGTLNHTFLSLLALERYGIPVIGVIINNAHNIERDFIYEDNVRTIRKRVAPVPCLDLGYGVDAGISGNIIETTIKYCLRAAV